MEVQQETGGVVPGAKIAQQLRAVRRMEGFARFCLDDDLPVDNEIDLACARQQQAIELDTERNVLVHAVTLTCERMGEASAIHRLTKAGPHDLMHAVRLRGDLVHDCVDTVWKRKLTP